ncbi:unnamed protein product [Schistosoma turkestanicum]|nr:unnamed protein product [Schistosoma turkestanicum]
MAFIPLVCLESPEIPNKYFRRTPIEDKGFVTYPGFLYVSGLAFMILNTLVVVFKHEKGSKLDETIRHFVKRLFCKSKHTKQSLNTEHTNEKSVNSLDQFYAKTDNDITYLKSSSLDCVLAGDTESTEVSAKSQPNQDEVEESENLSLLDTYKIIIGVIQLKPVALYLIIIILVKVCSFGVYFAINLKLIEQGFAKEKLALMTLAFVPVEFILPLLFVRYTVGPKPLTFGIMTFIPRLLSNCLFIPIIHFTPYFRMLNDNSMINHSNLTTLIDNTTTIHNNTLDMMINKPTYSFPWIFYGILTGGFLCEKITSVIIYVQFQAFNAKISDPVIGGTYMTLLNTVSNIANTLGSTICLALIEPLTIRSCSKNETHSGIGKNTAETLGNSSLSLDENKTTESCVKLFDGYFIEVIAFLIIGLISFIWFIYPKVKYLEKLPTTKFTYNPTNGERTCFTRLFNVCRKTEQQSLVLTNNIECIHDNNNDDRNDNHNKNTIYRDEINSSQTNHL